ncbi:MAG: hypothetical protein WAN60_03415 [Candidatus Sulfotelmatobacter sp.]
MTRHMVLVALLFGTDFISLVVLTLNIPVVNCVAFMFLVPGGIISAGFTREAGWSEAIILLIANTLIYSALTLFFVFRWVEFRREANSPSLRRLTIRLTVPSLILAGLACVPRLNPLWPHSFGELARQEADLQRAIPVGATLDQARLQLDSRQIKFREEIEDSPRTILSNGETLVTAGNGDRVLSSRFETNAYQFPCWYDFQIVLLFGPDGKLKDRYIHRFRICP